MLQGTHGRHFGAIPNAPSCLAVISTLFRTVAGWTVAWAFWRVLRSCAVSLTILMADLLLRSGWSIGRTRRVRASAGAFLGRLHLPVLTPLLLTASVQIAKESVWRTLFESVTSTSN